MTWAQFLVSYAQRVQEAAMRQDGRIEVMKGSLAGLDTGYQMRDLNPTRRRQTWSGPRNREAARVSFHAAESQVIIA